MHLSRKSIRKHSKTSSVVSIILAIGIVSATILIYYLTIYRPSHLASQQPSNPTSPTPTAPTSPAEPTVPPATTNYFTIPEWGVRFPMPEGYEGDIMYSIRTGVDLTPAVDGIGEVAYFYSISMSKWPDYISGCMPLVLTRSQNEIMSEKSIKVEDAWYQIANGGALCYTEHSSAIQNKFVEKLVKVIRALEPIKQLGY